MKRLNIKNIDIDIYHSRTETDLVFIRIERPSCFRSCSMFSYGASVCEYFFFFTFFFHKYYVYDRNDSLHEYYGV